MLNYTPLVYSKAGPQGGRLIRKVIRTFREQGVSLPLDSHILIAVSGGADSVGLAHLVIHLGRKMVRPSQVTLLHVNHQWRGEQSDGDARFVEELGRKWGVPVVVRKTPPPRVGSGESWENEARTERKKIFAQESARLGRARVLTAHHADDLAETVLWRILTGASETHGGGILFQSGFEVRPFLSVKKALITDYLAEAGESYRVDQTNFSDRFLRSRLRKTVMPELEKLFPKAVDHLGNLALRAQKDKVGPGARSPEGEVLQYFLLASGLRPRRVHLEMVEEKMKEGGACQGDIHLPQGWRLNREKDRQTSRIRWVLEKSE